MKTVPPNQDNLIGRSISSSAVHSHLLCAVTSSSSRFIACFDSSTFFLLLIPKKALSASLLSLSLSLSLSARESGSLIGADRRRSTHTHIWALLCVAERRATRPNGERGYSTRRHMGHECPEAVSPERGVVLTKLQSSI